MVLNNHFLTEERCHYNTKEGYYTQLALYKNEE